MCDCARDATQLDSVDRQQITDASRRLVNLFTNDVFILLIDRTEVIFDFASTPQFAAEMKANQSHIIEYIQLGENAVKQLNSGWHPDALQSFRLQCQQSRVFTFILSGTYRLIIINKYPQKIKNYDEAFEKDLKELCETVKRSIKGLSTANAGSSV